MKPKANALYTAEQSRQLDRIAIETKGIPGYTLMCRAGEFAFKTMLEYFPQSRLTIVVCGIGNNGGDGYVLARLAKQNGLAVRVLQLGDLSRQQGDALKAREEMESSGLNVETFDDALLADADLIVDAIFGTGLDRDVEGLWRDVIESINRRGVEVLSLDIPSGLHSDSGHVLGAAIEAKVTTTFIGRKRGLYTGKGVDHCGDILFDDLNVPSSIYDEVEHSASLWDPQQLDTLSKRRRGSHKGDNGHVLLIGGDQGMSGAIRMAGEACLRTGAGLVSVATRKDHAALIAQSRPELMCHGAESNEELKPLLQRADVVAIGPGLGTDDWGRCMLEMALDSQKKLIVDADALNLLSQQTQRYENWILTPHPGEAARLLDRPVRDIEKDRFTSCELVHNTYGGVCVLKGAGTLVSDGKEFVVCDKGNPGMASGGSGDVLTGVIAALCAQFPQRELYELAQMGVGIHALAGDLVAEQGERGLIASDIVQSIRSVVNRV